MSNEQPKPEEPVEPVGTKKPRPFPPAHWRMTKTQSDKIVADEFKKRIKTKPLAPEQVTIKEPEPEQPNDEWEKYL